MPSRNLCLCMLLYIPHSVTSCSSVKYLRTQRNAQLIYHQKFQDGDHEAHTINTNHADITAVNKHAKLYNHEISP